MVQNLASDGQFDSNLFDHVGRFDRTFTSITVCRSSMGPSVFPFFFFIIIIFLQGLISIYRTWVVAARGPTKNRPRLRP